MSLKSVSEMSEHLDHVFDQIVANGSEDELFASGYLRGHFDLVVARLQLEGIEDQNQFWPQLRENVEANKEELNTIDRDLVDKMLQRLERTARHPS